MGESIIVTVLQYSYNVLHAKCTLIYGKLDVIHNYDIVTERELTQLTINLLGSVIPHFRSSW